MDVHQSQIALRDIAALAQETVDRDGVLQVDLRSADSMSFAAAWALYTWARTKARRRRVRLLLPGGVDPARSVFRVLFESQFATHLRLAGVELSYWPDSGRQTELSLDTIRDTQHLRAKLNAVETSLLGTAGFRPTMLSELCETVLYELLENSLVHAKGHSNYLVIEAAKFNATSGAHDEALAMFSRDADYLDIALGDFGPGITTLLRKLVPKNYRPGLPSARKYLPAERTLAYAFEFLSTSNEPGRRRRLDELLGGADIDPAMISTGLSCVLNVLQRFGAQLIVWTNNAALSIDYSIGTARVRGAAELGIVGRGFVQGTHIFLRVPSVPHTIPRNVEGLFPQTDVIEDIRILRPFADPTLPEADLLHNALAITDEHIRQFRHTEGITVLPSSRAFLSSRARALFGAFLVSVYRGKRHILCMDDYFAALAPPGVARRYSPALDAGSVLLGDLTQNRFEIVQQTGLTAPPYLIDDSPKHHIALAPRVHRAVLAAYENALRTAVSEALQDPAVKLSPGPFFIEDAYYTREFFNISAALSEPRTNSAIMEWIALQVPDGVSSIAAASATMLGAAREIAASLTERRRTPIHAVWLDDTASMSQLRPPAAVLCDVICRGEALRANLRRIPLENLARVIVLVDARPQDATPRSIAVNDGATLELSAALRTSVATFLELPPVAAGDVLDLDEADVEHDDPEERVYLVDRHTHQPTLYVRRLRGNAETNKVLAAAAAAEALIYEHVEHQRRHYSAFLHLPRLFQALRPEIVSWILDQVAFVRRVETSESPWHVGLVDVDGSLRWLLQELTGRMRPAHIETLTWDLLRAPSPATNAEIGGQWLMIIPASASGEVVRRSVEYASRRRPNSILTLVVLARMEPSHQSFLMRVAKYGSALTRLAFFADFTVRAYPADGVACPMCLDAARLELLTRLPTDPDTDIAKALNDRLMRTRATSIQDDAGTPGFRGSAGDVARAHLRALYESAEYSVRARRLLQQALESDAEAADRFLELLGMERGSQHFAATELRARLGEAFDLLMNRVSEILWNEGPPLSLRAVLPAAVHLDEAGFVQASTRLLRAFAEHVTDVEEICVQLLLTNHRIPTEGDVLQDVTYSAATVRLILQLHDLLDERERRASQQRQSISAIERLWSRFARSSQFMDALKRLAGGDDAKGDDELTLALSSTLDAWNVEISPLWAQIATSELWPGIASRHADIARALDSLTGCVTRLRASLLQGQRGSTKRPMDSDAVALAISMEALTRQIARDMLARLFCNVVNAVADVVTGPLVLSDGTRTVIHLEIDYAVPPIFCDFDEYSRVVAQLIGNWAVYGAGVDAKVSLRIYQNGDSVITELTDNFPGEVQEDSEGGTRMARELCETYGGRFDLRRRGGSRLKAVSIALPVLGVIENRRLTSGVRRRETK